MNKIKQNKITFSLILIAISVIFSSLIILSLPVIFNYNSKVQEIEKNFYKNFKIYLKSHEKISYKPFPKPHLLVEKASLNLSETSNKNNLLNTSKLKIYITLRDIYLRSFKNYLSTEISDSNLELKMSDIKEFRKHLYKNINKPIIFNNCKIFIKNKINDVIIISPINKISYKINNKNKVKYFIIDGSIFGLDFKSEWKRVYSTPENSFLNINIVNPSVKIENILKYESDKKFNGQIKIDYLKDKLEYNFQFNNEKIKIKSPKNKKSNFNLDTEIQINPFFFTGDLLIKNKKVEKIIDDILLYFLLYEENYLGNLNGLMKIKFDNLNNKLIKKGEINFNIKEKKININEVKFDLNKIGTIKADINFIDDKGSIKFVSKNKLDINNHIEFAKAFQVGSKKVKKIKEIYFEIEKNVGDTDFAITNVKINNEENIEKLNEIFIVKNIQNLRSHIRKIID